MSLQKVQTFLKDNDYDGIFLRKKHNFSWVTGGRRNHIVHATEDGVADLLIFQDKVYVVTLKMEERRIIEEECAHFPFDVEVAVDDWYKGTDHVIEELTEGKRMASDVPFKDWDIVEGDLTSVRSVLSEDEQTRYKELCQIAAEAVESTCKEITPGQTEHEIAALLSSKAMAKGVNVQVALVSTDERIYKYRHPIPTDKKLEKQAMVVICAEDGGLVANATRFVYFGELPEELVQHKEQVARIDITMNLATKPGVRIGDVVQAGIAQYEAEGFPEDWKLLHQGGLTGYKSREFLATPDTDMIIQENQAFAWNPALPGVKSEDTILVTSEGIEFMTHTGDWVYQSVKVGNKIYQRPDILVR
ncbi:M24 family metallopeptidase [Salirhabdus salicampi]|uniref:M24 family metallopeptidase n=1 Tax=Salirhabdus salicampi TaxID=476102 RepID=UPI0020C281E4|nr:M24 family metallopeptidase [Salirhabdus salicampi]MCP8617546.1 M24 family metallopeptidase [Salirhabdus salicampi]